MDERCEVGGVAVDPWSIDVGVARPGVADERMTVVVSVEAMRYELEHAGLGEGEDVAAFIRADVARHRMVALLGYLDEVRGLFAPRRRRSWWRRLFTAEPSVAVRWWWLAMESVVVRDGMLVLTVRVARAPVA